MDNQIKVKNYTKRYVIWTYSIFWVGVLIAGALLLISKNEMIANIATIPLSWIPTIVLFVMFKRLIPNTSRKLWIKENFSSKINIKIVLITTLVLILSGVLTYVIMWGYNDAVLNLTDVKLSFGDILLEIIVCVITGATGEELGWRGYLQNHFEDKDNGNVINSALKVGLIWCFWHTPLWFVSATGSGVWFLIGYIATFIIENMCLSMIIAICYNQCKNIFIPMWIHFLSNITLSIMAYYFSTNASVIEGQIWMSVFYILMTSLFVLWHKKKICGKNEQQKI